MFIAYDLNDAELLRHALMLAGDNGAAVGFAHYTYRQAGQLIRDEQGSEVISAIVSDETITAMVGVLNSIVLSFNGVDTVTITGASAPDEYYWWRYDNSGRLLDSWETHPDGTMDNNDTTPYQFVIQDDGVFTLYVVRASDFASGQIGVTIT